MKLLLLLACLVAAAAAADTAAPAHNWPQPPQVVPSKE